MKSKARTNVLEDEEAISAVVGAILMIAVTVVIGATVYAVVNGFGDETSDEGPNAVYKAQSVDTDGNGVTDHIKVSYLTGPAEVDDDDVDITVRSADGDDADASAAEPAEWSPGDFMIFENPTGTTEETYFVTVSILDTTVVDTTLALDEEAP